MVVDKQLKESKLQMQRTKAWTNAYTIKWNAN